MEEVSDLLVAWGLPDLRENFIKNEINLQALSALTPEDIKELIPLLGPRTLFIRNWKEWNPNINTTIDGNMSLPGGDFSNLDIISLSDITVQDFNEEKTETADVHVVVAEQSKTSPNLDLASTKTTTSFYVIENNLEEDFNASYPEEQNNFYLNFPGLKKTLIRLLKEKKSKDAQEYLLT